MILVAIPLVAPMAARGQTQSGRTALISAAFEGHTECVRLLLEGGADKDVKTTVRTKQFLP